MIKMLLMLCLIFSAAFLRAKDAPKTETPIVVAAPSLEQCKQLAQQLVSDTFEIREKALQELCEKGFVWQEALEKFASNNNDPELKSRLLQSRNTIFNQTMDLWVKTARTAYSKDGYKNEKAVSNAIQNAAPLKELCLKMADPKDREYLVLRFKSNEALCWYSYARQDPSEQNAIYNKCIAVYDDCLNALEKLTEKYPKEKRYEDLMQECSMVKYACKKSIQLE